MQEQQPVATFARENSNPCNLGLYSCSRYLSQQQFERQLNATPHQQGRSTSARFFTKKHQFDPTVQRENQNHGQVDKIPNKSTAQMSGTPHDILHTINMKKDRTVTTPKANGQMPEISAITVRRNPQDRACIQQETDAAAQITEQKQQGSISAIDQKRIQIEINAPVDSDQTWMKDLTDLLAAPSQNDINDILVKEIQDIGINERTGDLNQPENAIYMKDFPPLQGRSTTSTPLSVQSPPTIIEDKYAPSLSYQINFHLSLLTWCKAAMDNHRYMAQQHHHTSSGHTWQIYLSLLAHHEANHHAYQLELAQPFGELHTKPSEDSNGTSLSEDSARPSATKEQTKETTSTNEREIICTVLSED